MKMYVYTLRDAAGSIFGRPFYSHNIAHATRSLADQVNDPADGQNDLFKHAHDFELFELGSFDDATARFELHPDPVSICQASSLKKKVSA